MATISGRVVDYDSNSPLQGVLVQGVNPDGTFIGSTNTNADGNFTLTDTALDNPASKITFTADGYATQSMQPASANGVDVVLPKSGTLASFTVTVKRSPMKALFFVGIGALIVYLLIKYKHKLPL
jgi:hypothetical protein